MQIRQQPLGQNSIQRYEATSVTINNLVYTKSLCLTAQTLDTDWPVTTIASLNESHLAFFIENNCSVILIGHNGPPSLLTHLHLGRIGLETLSIGAACRTYNLLIAEKRQVGLGLIFS